jgi:RHS repeat-associated protein
VQKSYQYSPWGERLSQVTHHADGSEEDAFYGYNPHTDVEVLTDQAGDAVSTYGYTAYGTNDEAEFTGIDAPDPGTPGAEPYNVYRYNAKRWDPASGTYDMGFRDYNPGINRFLSRDMYTGALNDLNLGLSPWTNNRYAFTGGNPVTLIEHDGHEPRPWHDPDFNSDTFNYDTYWAAERAAFGSDAEQAAKDQSAYNLSLTYITNEMITNATGEEASEIKKKRNWARNLWVCSPVGWLCMADRTADGLDMFAEQVQSGGPWDHKDSMLGIYAFGGDEEYTKIEGRSEGVLFNVWSNVHYGYVGTEIGISAWTLQEAADAGNWPVVGEYLEPTAGVSTRGDRISIDIGIQLRRTYAPHELTVAAVHEAIVGRIPDWRTLRAPQICLDANRC